MDQIVLVYILPKETVNAVLMPYKNTKAMVWWADSDPDIFDIVSRVLERDTSVLIMLMLSLNYELLTSIDSIKEKKIKY